MVTFNGKLYGKPKNEREASKMIKDLTQTGLPNVVYSGLAIYYEGRIHNFTEVTTVYMMRLTDEEIENYLKTGEYIGKAGGFGVQGLAGSFVERIDGDINNVIGLPLSRLAKELKTILRL